LNLRVWCICD